VIDDPWLPDPTPTPPAAADPGPVEHDVPPDGPPEPTPGVPADLDSERATLGAMLLSPDALLTVLDTVTAAQFWDPRHERIYDAIEAVFAGTGQVPDTVTVLGHLQRTRQLREAGGHAYLGQLPMACPSPARAARYAQSVADHATLRGILAATTHVQALIRSGDTTDVPDLAAEAVAAVTAAADTTTGADLIDVADLLGQVAEQLADPPENGGVLWPGRDLNIVLLPMRPGEFIVIGARPGIGKTTFLLDVAANAAIRQQIPTLFVSLEMTRTEIGECLLSAEGSILKARITQHALDDAEWSRVWRTQETIGTAPLVIVDDARTGLDQLDRLIRRGWKGKPWGLVCYDYLQLAPGRPGGRAENRQVEVAGISRALKLLAKRHRVPIATAAQLNRALESRADKKPGMADLRESGGIEADADKIVLLHREDAHDPESPRGGEIDFVIAKQRRGPTDIVTLASQLHLSRFRDMA
jgi:replicative DNA helicase